MPRKLATACSVRNCPNLKPCPDHVPRRASRQERGYGRQHDRLRATWELKILQCDVKCARCSQLVLPGMKWHLDHTDDRTGYLGPSHERCNTSAGGKAAHR